MLLNLLWKERGRVLTPHDVYLGVCYSITCIYACFENFRTKRLMYNIFSGIKIIFRYKDEAPKLGFSLDARHTVS